MHFRAARWFSCLLLLPCCLAWPSRGEAQVRSAEELAQARARRPQRVAQAAAAIDAELQRRSVRSIEKKIRMADATRLARSLSDAQLAALEGGADLVRTITGERLATARQELRAVAADAIGAPDSELLFVPLAPCRVIDTRFAGGKFVPSEKRDFEVTGTENFAAQGGNPGGCGVPIGASQPLAAAVAINFIAVEPDGGGHLTAWEFGQPEPFASVINYAKVGLNIANGVIVPVAGVSTIAKDLSIRAAVAPTHVVADVTGYFTRFPIEEFQGGLKSEVVTNTFNELISLSDGGCKELVTCVLTAPAAGTVLVEAWNQVVVNHTMGTTDRYVLQVETAGSVSCPADDDVNASDVEVPSAMPSNSDFDFTLSHGRTFPINAGQTVTYRLSGRMVNGFGSLDTVENSRLICTFIPD